MAPSLIKTLFIFQLDTITQRLPTANKVFYPDHFIAKFLKVHFESQLFQAQKKRSFDIFYCCLVLIIVKVITTFKHQWIIVE